ncbi:hypothetical protein SteCoe_9262 [Stentor coeruleus]|uniref:GST N-terminal domain-containing protein n=1 Tax=Stentor coeruleus TaxID=5963 RepID=A0A1R2CID8_9CILI|nr:hypothetical protein SteCoe_9262 [Stentor coeruleus]
MSITLHYFDLYARAEPIRVILNYRGLRYDERLYSFQEWPSIKDQFEFQELPCLEIDGLKLVQSASITKYLCQKLGYSFKDPYLNYLTCSLVDVRDDFITKKIQLCWHEKNPEGWIDWIRNDFSHILKAIERRYKHNGETGFFVGNSPSVADFVMFVMLHDQFLREKVSEKMRPILESAAPKLIEFVESFKNSSETLVNYLSNRPERDF